MNAKCRKPVHFKRANTQGGFPMTNLQEIAHSDDYGQYELKDLYQATQLLLQEFQKSKTEPEKLNDIISHLKERLKGQAAFPLAILLESSQLGIRHQLQKNWN